MKNQTSSKSSKQHGAKFRLAIIVTTLVVLTASSAHAGKGAYLYFVNHSDSTMSFECDGSREGLTDNSEMCNKVDGTVSPRSAQGATNSAERIYIEERKSASVTYMKIRIQAGSFDDTVKIYAKGDSWHVGHVESPKQLSVSIDGSGSQDKITFELGSNRNWMASLPNKDIPLNQLLLMGTHDSTTAKYARDSSIFTGPFMVPYVVTQSMSIPEQLRFGIRFLDLRFGCLDSSCNKISLVHGSVQLFHHMVPTMDDIVKFLRDNPSEAVIVSMKIDDDKHSDAGSKIVDAISNYIARNRSSFYNASRGTKPKFSEVQGKIYIVDRTGGASSGDLGTVGSQLYVDDDVKFGEDGVFRYQDRYQNPDYDEKINAVRAFGKDYMNANHFNCFFNLNFLSAAGADGSTIKDYASRVNSKYFAKATFGSRHAGIYIMDFPKVYSGAPKEESYYFTVDKLIHRSLQNSATYTGGPPSCP